MAGIKRRQIGTRPEGHRVGKWPDGQLPVNTPFLGSKGRAQATAPMPGELPAPPALAASREAGVFASERLGPPLSIRQVAALIGCSPWSVRQTLIPKGLPVFRSGASGKLIFYESQIVRWIEQKQHKGGF